MDDPPGRALLAARSGLRAGWHRSTLGGFSDLGDECGGLTFTGQSCLSVGGRRRERGPGSGFAVASVLTVARTASSVGPRPRLRLKQHHMRLVAGHQQLRFVELLRVL